jgi:hypothetical protein
MVQSLSLNCKVDVMIVGSVGPQQPTIHITSYNICVESQRPYVELVLTSRVGNSTVSPEIVLKKSANLQRVRSFDSITLTPALSGFRWGPWVQDEIPPP